MIQGNFYCIYDNLYEEFQKPFVMPNDKVALMEFEIFKNSLKDKNSTNEGASKIDKRYKLMKYEGITFNQADGFFFAKDNSIPCFELTYAEDEE